METEHVNWENEESNKIIKPPTETKKGVIDKGPLPTKTKIATFWMLSIGGIMLLYGLIKLFQKCEEFYCSSPAKGLIFGPLLIISALGLLKLKRKYIWVFIVSITIEPFLIDSLRDVFVFRSAIDFLNGILFLVPLVLFLIDSGNFWKIAK
ncbi:MAG: hypothetical protein PHF44_01610 [Candidatus Pacebacteria bacterium]|nr:hypothetical protein [Candidatus Paceibacterota bacterium]